VSVGAARSGRPRANRPRPGRERLERAPHGTPPPLREAGVVDYRRRQA